MIALINDFISGLGSVASVVLGLLPASPFSFDTSAFSGFLGIINYFIPLQSMATELSVFVPAVGLYYAVRVMLRWTKVGD